MMHKLEPAETPDELILDLLALHIQLHASEKWSILSLLQALARLMQIYSHLIVALKGYNNSLRI